METVKTGGAADTCNRMKLATASTTVAALVVGLSSLLAGGCASTGAVPRPFPLPGSGTPAAFPDAPPVAGPSSDDASADGRSRGESLARTALGFAGTPYRLGGSDPGGFDCSGLVQYVLARHGVGVPRVVEDQAQLGREVGDDEIRPGDLVFFAIGSRKPSHVGIAIDGERFVHAPRSGQRVRVDALSAPYWRKRYREARRIEPGPASGGPMLSLGDEAP